MKVLLLYISIAVAYESIQFYIAWKKFNKFMSHDELFDGICKLISRLKSVQHLKKRLWNWYIVSFLYVPLFLIICPFLFPFTVLGHIRKMIFGKTKLEKEADEELKSMKEAKNQSDEFMRTEGFYFHEVVDKQ